ncbi:hypothetical protein HYH03_003094 [Edaphochlamys debaryana]|uniref:Ricin B lectin domain-containing protein n=1 Tax=Edaphochlamys debaryana TaxID=47281 RepID=A0A835YA58_9CHLO|nr:hypothetical protein HYH03_003094 [Edaphochlamys debaryana]|eukprot:KAG2498903.1 hypothetical protein HYH03_003094 [Edaphochlamys debaryana]
MVKGNHSACLTASAADAKVQAKPCSSALAAFQAWRLCRAGGACAPVDHAIRLDTSARAAAAAARRSLQPGRPAFLTYDDPKGADVKQGRAARVVGGPSVLKGARSLDLLLPDGSTATLTDLTPTGPDRSGLPAQDAKPACTLNGKPNCPPDMTGGAGRASAGPACLSWNAKLEDDLAGYSVITKCGSYWSAAVSSGRHGNWLVTPEEGAAADDTTNGAAAATRYVVRPNTAPLKGEGPSPQLELSSTHPTDAFKGLTFAAEGADPAGPWIKSGNRRMLQQAATSSSCNDTTDRLYLAVYVLNTAWDSTVQADIATGIATTNGALQRAGSPFTISLHFIQQVSSLVYRKRTVDESFSAFGFHLPPSVELSGADLALLVVDKDMPGSIGIGMQEIGGVGVTLTITALLRNWVTTIVFPHELAHNLGLKHDRERVLVESPTYPMTGYHFAPWAFVDGHCTSWTSTGTCLIWHYNRAVMSIAGYTWSSGCESKNFINQQGAECTYAMDYGFTGFTTCIDRVAQTGDLDGTLYKHTHCNVPLGNAGADPGRVFKENALKLATNRNYGCENYWPDQELTFTGNRSCWVGSGGFAFTPLNCNDKCNGDAACDGVTFYEGAKVCCILYSTGDRHSLRPSYTLAQGSWGRPWSKKRGGLSNKPPGGLVCPSGSTWSNAAWRCNMGAVNYTRVVATYNGGGQVIDLSGWSSNDGASLIGYNYTGANNQKWILVPTDDAAYFQMVSVHTGKCWDVAAGGTADGTRIQQWTCQYGNNNQKFMLRQSGYYRYELAPKVALSKCALVGAAGSGGALTVGTCLGGQTYSFAFA